MRKRFFPVCLFLALAFPLHAQGFFSEVSWFFGGSVLFFPEDNGMESGTMPVLPSPGLGASRRFNEIFRIEATLDFYRGVYGYNDALQRAVPLEWEHRSAQVIGSVLGIQAAAYYEVFSLITLRAFAGLAADLRIILIAPDLSPDDMDDASKQTESVRSYFWSEARWFLPFAGLGFDFPMNERFKIGVDLRSWAPAYRLWSGEDLPAIEGWRFGGGLRFTFR
jgi:hypothetical protein